MVSSVTQLVLKHWKASTYRIVGEQEIFSAHYLRPRPSTCSSVQFCFEHEKYCSLSLYALAAKQLISVEQI